MKKEQIKDLARFMRARSGTFETLISEWFEQNPQQQAFVGLSDEQVDSLRVFWNNCEGLRAVEAYKEWAKTQTFAQPVEITNVELGDAYQALMEEYSKLKAQVFQPDWSDAPSWANWLSQGKSGGWSWYEFKPTLEGGWWSYHQRRYDAYVKSENWQGSLQQRPPAPKVEVGQVWGFHGSSVEIVMVTEFQIVMKSIETGNLSIDDDIEDFLANFERIGE
jgi:hypothetical protein